MSVFVFALGPANPLGGPVNTHTHTRTHTRILRHFLLFFFKMLPVTELMADVTFFQLTQPLLPQDKHDTTKWTQTLTEQRYESQ